MIASTSHSLPPSAAALHPGAFWKLTRTTLLVAFANLAATAFAVSCEDTEPSSIAEQPEAAAPGHQ